MVVRRRRWPSPIWAVPFVALLAAGWLIYTAMAEMGPEITISFATAEGLEAGKTRIKYRDIDVGTVTDIIFNEDLTRVVITAELRKEMTAHLTDNTRFWVVRPRLSASGVSGLDTLVSGAYLALDPAEGEPQRQFVGLEEPPPIRAIEASKRFVLEAPSLGSIAKGSPVLFRGIQVGEVLDHHLAEDNSHVRIEIFVRGAQAQMIRPGTRFWNASGVSARLGAGGAEVSVASMQALLTGGIAFETPSLTMQDVASEDGDPFPLYSSYDAQEAESFTDRAAFVAYFSGSMRGLSPGAPVEYRGIRVGTVTDVRLQFDPDTNEARVPVTFVMEPQRIRGFGAGGAIDPYREMQELVKAGLRAQLETGNLLTGQLYINLTVVPNAPSASLDVQGDVALMPTVPTDLERIGRSVTDALEAFAQLPLAEIVEETRASLEALANLLNMPEIPQAVRSVDATLGSAEALMGAIEADVTPLIASLRRTADEANEAIAQASGIAAETRDIVGEGTQTRHNLDETLAELAGAARSIRLLADYLEQYPEALLRGKGGR